MSSTSGTPVRLEVTDIMVGGECPVGIKIGDSWLIEDGIVPAGICAAALNAIQPYVVALRFGGTIPWSGEKEFSACCPDPANPVVFTMTAVSD